MEQNNTISIVVASDNHYAILIAALLKSIDLNHKTGEHIDFYIIDDGIANDNKAKLQKVADPGRVTLKWHQSKTIVPPGTVIPIDNTAFPLTTYLRIFSPDIVQNADKIIYLDADTIVLDDISNLWNIPLGEHIVGAVLDPGKTVDCAWAGIPNYKELGLKSDTKYFNAGVLLINAKRWRDENVSGQVISALTKYRQHVRMADQYGINVVMANKWLELHPKWNWFSAFEGTNPSLVHFLDIKPIFKSYNTVESYRDAFFYYLSMTPWKNFKPVSGNKRLIRKAVNKVKKRVKRIFVKQ